MMHGKRRTWILLLTAVAILPALGCALAASALNPNLLSQLGFDPNTIFPSTGTVIVVFDNQTSSVVVFNVWYADDPVAFTGSSHNISIPVDPTSTDNEVLNCPVGGLAPGTLGADFKPTTDAAVVQTGATPVAYNGATLISGRDFECGDVVIVHLTQQAGQSGQGGTTNPYAITVQVVPGR